jgi:hypothetical protein
LTGRLARREARNARGVISTESRCGVVDGKRYEGHHHQPMPVIQMEGDARRPTPLPWARVELAVALLLLLGSQVALLAGGAPSGGG